MNIDVTVILCSAWIWGIHCMFSEGFIFYKAGVFLEKTIGTTACKPIFLCPPCMSSVHGVVWSIAFCIPVKMIIPFIIALCGVNFIIKKFVYPDYEE